MAKNAKILFLFSLLVLTTLIKDSQGALFYFYNFNPTQVQIPSMDKVRCTILYHPFWKYLVIFLGTRSFENNFSESSVSPFLSAVLTRPKCGKLINHKNRPLLWYISSEVVANKKWSIHTVAVVCFLAWPEKIYNSSYYLLEKRRLCEFNLGISVMSDNLTY